MERNTPIERLRAALPDRLRALLAYEYFEAGRDLPSPNPVLPTGQPASSDANP